MLDEREEEEIEATKATSIVIAGHVFTVANREELMEALRRNQER